MMSPDRIVEDLPPEIEERIGAIAEKPKTPRVFWWILGVVMTTLIIVIALLAYRYSDSATASNQVTILRRQDCARELSARQNQVRDNAAKLDREVNRQFYSILLNAQSSGQTQIGQTVVEAFAALEVKADAADRAVANLPPLDDIVNAHCPGSSH